MAHDESSFKVEFRKALEKHYGKNAKVWTNNDMFRAGLPDFSAHHNGHLTMVEAKFIKVLPARKTSKVLKHELSGIQANFLMDIHQTGGTGLVLVGMEDTAIACSIDHWPTLDSNGLKVPASNLTLDELHHLRDTVGRAYYKNHTGWDLRDFLADWGKR